MSLALEVLNGKRPWSVEESDCVSWFNSLPEASVDLVFGSPPYEEARTYHENDRDIGIARGTEEWVAWMLEVYTAALRVCKGVVAFVVGHGAGCHRWSGAPYLLCADLIRRKVPMRPTVFYVRDGVMGSGGKDWFKAKVEHVLCAAKVAGRLPWSDNTAEGHPPKYAGIGGVLSYRTKDDSRIPSHRSRSGRRVGNKVIRADGSEYKLEIANPGNVVECVVGGGHLGSPLAHENEAPFPEKLAKFFVRSLCPEGGVVCDPFSGSGTTVAVCLKWGRRFVGCDLRASQVELTTRRVQSERNLFSPPQES